MWAKGKTGMGLNQQRVTYMRLEGYRARQHLIEFHVPNSTGSLNKYMHDEMYESAHCALTPIHFTYIP